MSAPKRRTISDQWTAQEMYPYRAATGSAEIEAEVTRLFPTQPYGTHGSVCADLLLGVMRVWPGKGRDETIKLALRFGEPLIGSVLVYSKNDKATGRRVPKSAAEQRLAFRRNLFAAYPLATAALSGTTAPVAPIESAIQSAIDQPSNGRVRYGDLPVGSMFKLSMNAPTTWIKLDSGDKDISRNYTSPPESPSSVVYPAESPAESKCSMCGNVVASPQAIWWIDAQQCASCYSIAQAEPKAPKAPKAPKTDPNLALAHRDWCQTARRLCESKAADGQPLWDWGMRNGIDGAAIILAAMQEGREVAVPVAEAVRDACTMHFPDAIRSEMGVNEPFDFVGFGVPRYLEIVAKARVPLPRGKTRSVCSMLVGPMGSGKSTAAEALAEALDIPYGKVSMTRGTSPTAFNGKQRVTDDGSLLGVLTAIARSEHDIAKRLAESAMDRGDVTVSQWVRIYTGGGVFLFDEIDAADSNLLLIVNDALSSAGFANAATGETLARSEAFVGLAAGNTVGLGADRIYGGRERLDGATLDRWAAGRVRVGYDNALEDSIIEGMVGA